MKQVGHNYEDKLLEFAYGELPEPEARSLEAHVKGCPRCADVLGNIRGVRKAMGQLPAEPAPGEGLESLLAYAEQSARRSAVGPAPTKTWWRRLVVPAMGAMALGLVGVVTLQVLEHNPLAAKPGGLAPSAKREVASLEKSSAPVTAAAPAPPPVQAAAPAQDAPAAEGKEALAQGQVWEPSGATAQGPLRRQRQAGKAAELSNEGYRAAGEKDRAEASLDALDQKQKAEANAQEDDGRFAGNMEQTPPAAARPYASPKPADKAANAAPSGGLKAAEPVQAEKKALARLDRDEEPVPNERRSNEATQMAQAPAPERQSLKLGLGTGSTASTGSLGGGRAGGTSSLGDTSRPSTRAIEPDRESPAAEPRLAESLSSKVDARPSAKEQAVQVEALLAQVRQAQKVGDLRGALEWLRRAESAGASDRQRTEVLKRRFDVYVALGDEQAAELAYKQLLREFPGTGAAKVASKEIEVFRSRARSASQGMDSLYEEESAKPSPSKRAKAKKKAEPPAASPAEATPGL